MRATVGVFDSGVGGLTVAEALHRLAPTLEIRYLADTSYFPYGERPATEIAERALVMVGRLIAEGANVIVVACNTASSAALERLRAAHPDAPIVGMEPPVKPAVEHSRSRRVLVLATAGTASGERLARLTATHRGDAEVITVPMPGLADLVEDGQVAGPRVEALLHEALDAPLATGVDQVALGCTHYGFLRPMLARLLPASVELVDAAEPVARQTLRVIASAGLEVDAAGPEREVFCYASGDAAAFEATVDRLRTAGAALPPMRISRPVA